jgi:hypothetical protein
VSNIFFFPQKILKKRGKTLKDYKNIEKNMILAKTMYKLLHKANNRHAVF